MPIIQIGLTNFQIVFRKSIYKNMLIRPMWVIHWYDDYLNWAYKLIWVVHYYANYFYWAYKLIWVVHYYANYLYWAYRPADCTLKKKPTIYKNMHIKPMWVYKSIWVLHYYANYFNWTYNPLSGYPLFKETKSVSMNIFFEKNIFFFLNHL